TLDPAATHQGSAAMRKMGVNQETAYGAGGCDGIKIGQGRAGRCRTASATSPCSARAVRPQAEEDADDCTSRSGGVAAVQELPGPAGTGRDRRRPRLGRGLLLPRAGQQAAELDLHQLAQGAGLSRRTAVVAHSAVAAG